MKQCSSKSVMARLSSGPLPARVQRRDRRARLSAAVVALPLMAALGAVTGTSGASTLYWDINGATSGGSSTSGAAGNWDSTTANWTTDSTGSSPTQAWAPGSDAVFAAGTTVTGGYNVTISGTQSLSSILVEEGNSTLTGTGTLDFGAAGGTYTAAVAKTLSILVPIAGGDFTFDNTSSGNAVLNISSQPTFTGNLNIGAGTSFSNLTEVQLDYDLANSSAVINMHNFSVLADNNIVKDGAGNSSQAIYTVHNAINLSVDNVAGAESSIAAANGRTVTYAGVISGNSNVNFAYGSSGGRGTVVLGAQETYVGDTYMNLANNNGLLQMGVDNALPAATNLTFGGTSANDAAGTAATNAVAPMDLAGHLLTVASINTNTTGNAGGIYNTGAATTLTINGTKSTTYKGLIGSTAVVAPFTSTSGLNTNISLVKNGPSSLTLTANNPYTGDTNINGGTLVLGKTFSWPGAPSYTLLGSNVNVNSGGTLATIAGTGTTFAGAGAGVTANSGSIIAPGGDGGIGGLVANSMTINDGATLKFDLGNLSNFDSIYVNNPLTLDSGTHLVDIAGFASPGNYNLITHAVGISGGTFTLGTTPGGSFNYTLSDNGSFLTLGIVPTAPVLRWDADGNGLPATEGDGTWSDGSPLFIDLSTNAQANWDNTANHDAIIGDDSNQLGGTITLGSNIRVGGQLSFGPLFPGSSYTITDGGAGYTFTTAQGINASNSAEIDAATILEASQRWDVSSGATLTLTKSLTQSNPSTLTKTGNGVLILGGSGGNIAGLNINAGIVALGAVDSIGAAPVSIDTGTLLFGGSGTFTNSITFSANGGGLGSANNAVATLTGNLTSTGPVTFSTAAGAGTLNLSGTNSLSGGVTITGGIVGINAPAALGGGSTILLSGTASSHAELQLTAPMDLSNNIALTHTGATNNNIIDTGTNAATLSGVISGSGDLFVHGTGDLTLSGANTWAGGAFNVEDPRTIIVANPSALGTGTFVVDANTTLNVASDTLTAGLVRGNATVTKTGAGTLVITGITPTASTGPDPGANLAFVINQGAVEMSNPNALGGRNAATAPLASQGDITLNAGTELLLNAAGSRYSRNITLNDADIRRISGNVSGDMEFAEYTSTGNPSTPVIFGGTFTVNGNSSIINNEQALAAQSRDILVRMPVLVTSGSTLTLQADNTAGNYEQAAIILRGVFNNTDNPGDNVTIQGGGTIVAQGTGDIDLGGTGTGKPLVGQGTPGNEAVLKLGSHAFMRDIGSATDRSNSTEMTKFVIEGSGNAGLRVEAPMNATYTDPGTAAAPPLRTYDGTTGLFGINTTSTANSSGFPSGYTQIANGFTVLSPNRAAALSNTYTTSNGTVVTPSGTLTLAATDAAGATGVVNSGPAAPCAVALALDNTPTSGNLIYQIDPAANGGTVADYAGLTVQRSNTGGGVTAQLLGFAKTPALNVTGGAQLDVSDKGIAVAYGSASPSPIGTWNGTSYTGLTGLIQSGYNAKAWNGPGIITSQADAISGLTGVGIAEASSILGITGTNTATWNGQTVDGNTVLIRYTYAGDANLDGRINIDDYGRIDGSVGQSGSVFGWYNGDFNYDGKINIDDYGIIDGNIGKQGAPFPDNAVAATSELGGVSAVPEPCSLALIGAGAAGLLTRRRRRIA